jgi:hypothetical protein
MPEHNSQKTCSAKERNKYPTYNREKQREELKQYINTILSFCSSLYVTMINILKSMLYIINVKCKEHITMDFSAFTSNIQIIFLGTEIFTLMYHVSMIVRLWVLMNFTCAILSMYNTLSIKCKKDRYLPVCKQDIKNLSTISIGTGICLVFFYTPTIGVMTLPCILYTLNRTCGLLHN